MKNAYKAEISTIFLSGVGSFDMMDSKPGIGRKSGFNG